MSTNPKKSPSEILQEMALEYSYFLSQKNEVLVEISTNNTTKIIQTSSEEFKNHLIYQLFLEGCTIGNEALNNILSLLCAKAQFEAPKIATAERIGVYKNIFYYDLANTSGECVKVSSKGYEILKKSPIVFLHSKVNLEQMCPEYSNSIDIWSLRKYFNVSCKNDFILLIVHIIACFVPEIPHHILIFLGNQGSAKTTASKIVKSIIDPSIVDIAAIPKSKEDLILQLSSEYLIAYDNIASLKPEYNDIFCQVVTGGNFLKRKLYTDSELVVCSYKRCLILNGISYLTTQSDLLDRSIVINLAKISGTKRKTEKDIFNSFNHELPYILHSIFETLSKAKKIHSTLKVERLPRMADAVLWHCAIAEALDIDHEEYLELYYDNQNAINQEILSAHPLAYSVLEFMQEKRKWKGSITDLWCKLDALASLKNINKNDPLWAKSPSSLSRQLNQLKVNLEKVNIYFDIRNTGKHKEITIRNSDRRN